MVTRSTSTMPTPIGGRHAVVIGGSMAGLLHARVLADHFDLVTIVERDRLPDTPAFRQGVPHARHVHLLLPRGRQVVEHFLPGFARDLIGAGARVVDMAEELAWHTAAGWAPRFRSGLTMMTSSRYLLEWTVRRHVTALPTIAVLERTAVTGLLPGPGDRVGGVLARSRDGATDGGADRLLEADLVVDTTGRHSAAPEWLSDLGYAPPAETVVNAHPGYASRMFAMPAHRGQDWEAILVQPLAGPNQPRAGIMIPIEGGRWMCSLVGLSGDYAPTDEDGYFAFARSLASPLLYEAIKDATPLTPVHGYREIANQRRQYDKMARRPENFLVSGDAACAFNPVYAQGMTTAALGAATLAACLRQGSTADLGRRFQKQLATVNAAPWLLATGDDLRLPTTEGGTISLGSRLTNAYLDRTLAVSLRDLDVRRTMLEVFSMLKPPSALFAPPVAGKVLRAAIGRRSRAAPRPVIEAPAA